MCNYIYRYRYLEKDIYISIFKDKQIKIYLNIYIFITMHR